MQPTAKFHAAIRLATAITQAAARPGAEISNLTLGGAYAPDRLAELTGTPAERLPPRGRIWLDVTLTVQLQPSIDVRTSQGSPAPLNLATARHFLTAAGLDHTELIAAERRVWTACDGVPLALI